MLAFLLFGCSDNIIGKRFYAPEVAIVSPVDGDRAWRDAPTPVVARVSDADTPDPSTLTVSWSTDNGTVATTDVSEDGTFLAMWTPARDGSAEIRALVVDADAQEASASVRLEVSTNERPTVALTSPEDDEVLRQDRSTTLRAEADDDGGANFLTVGWTLDGEALEGCDATTSDGVIACVADELPVVGQGLELCVAVTDALGLSASDCRRIDVVACPDADGDGVSTCDGDCDDDDGSTFPGAEETCDGEDDDCDGTVDEAGGATWYADADADGYGDSAAPTDACTVPSGFVANDDDCDDSRADVSPADAEVCDGADNDCDGSVDDGVGSIWHADADADGYGDPSATATACSAPSGYVANDDDCDDARADVSPADAEACDGADNDCDGSVDEGVETTFYADADTDGYGNPAVTTDACAAPSGYVADATDCDDARADVSPADAEVCDGADNDCDGSVDDGVGSTWHADADADGYGDPSATATACTAPSGYVTNDDDCDDSRADVSPADAEVCDGADNDCDGAVDEGVETTFYADADADGYGDPAVTDGACSAPTGFVANDDDCDDARADVSPADAEACDGADNDCDGSVDEGVETTFYADADADGYGNPAATDAACSAPTGYVANDDDCDDTDASINPGAASDVTDGVDADCDGEDAPCGSSTRYVPAEYVTIQDAIEASCDGDRIEVSAGTYPEDIDTRFKVLDIVGVDGSAVTQIVGSGTDTVVTMLAAGTLQGFAISGGRATEGAGIYLAASSGSVVLSDLEIYDNVATSDGGGLYLVLRGSVSFVTEDLYFHDNAAASFGGGAHAQSYVTMTHVWSNVRFASNVSTWGAAISLRGDWEVENARFLDNTAGYGAVYSLSSLTLHHAAFFRNTSYYGAVFVDSDGYAEVYNTVIAGNTGDLAGGIFANSAAVLYLHNSDLVGNTGYGLFCNGGAPIVTVVNVGVAYNSNAVNGGCSSASIQYGNFYGNTGGVAPSGTANVAVDPGYVSYGDALDPEDWDLHLHPSSALIDAGSPSVSDPDGTRSDIGAYGGPEADADYYADADADGLYDGWEDLFGLDPTVDDALDDTDGDGLDNVSELDAGTWPDVADTDGDGAEDGLEVSRGTDPLT